MNSARLIGLLAFMLAAPATAAPKVELPAVAIIVGTVPTAYGFPWYLSIPIGMAVLAGALAIFGKVSDTTDYENSYSGQTSPVARGQPLRLCQHPHQHRH